VALLTALGKGSFTVAEWTVERSQEEAVTTIHDTVSAGLLAEPGYRANHTELAWYNLTQQA
jgi:predicted transcriptional regulator of viral defense system